MDREILIREIKDVYASLADNGSQHHFVQTTTQITPEAYYEKLLNMVLYEIDHGTFDRFQSGKAIMEAVAKDKHKWLSQWDANMEV